MTIPNTHIILQTNSPGELAAWVTPIARTFKQQDPTCFITVCLVPCQYATGQEKRVAEHLTDVDAVFSPKDTITMLFGLKKAPKAQRLGAVVFLGGDPFYTQLLAFQ